MRIYSSYTHASSADTLASIAFESTDISKICAYYYFESHSHKSI